MKQQIQLLLMGFLIMTAVLLATACDPDNNGEEDVGDDFTTKAGIEAYINTHWQEYGYSTKPTKYVSLSFDDGPCPVSEDGGTAALLDALEAAKVKTTFFVIGENVKKNPDIAKAIVDAGHEIANHSNGYGSLGNATLGTITDSLNAATTEIKDATGVTPTMFRAPNVNYGANLTKICTELGFPIIGVRVWSDDYNSTTTVQQIKDKLANPKDGDIINCHDNNTSKGKTVTALPDVVSNLRQKGFWILPVGQLAIVKGVTLQAGVQYDTIPKDN